MYEELVGDLRYCDKGDCNGCRRYTKNTIFCNALLREAADAIEELSKRVPPVPHGRLIDADAYESLLRGIGNREYRRENGTICDAIKFLHPHYAPTIIPASEEAKT